MNNFDAVDERIVEMLKQDSSVPVKKIAERLHLSDVAIHKRIGKLRKQGVIERFSVELDYEKLGRQVSAFIWVNARADAMDELRAELAKRPEVLEAYSIISDYGLLFKAAFADVAAMKSFVEGYLGKMRGIGEVKVNVVFSKIKS